ncbi:MAG: VTT domain-containing protein [Candidatus Pacebacteria bacterium]|nr:VTT domain-containing protein [Candidatus Paceibacterota bacterium]
MDLLNIFIHLDVYLSDIVSAYGALSYLFLSGIVFLETGIVFTPFLPGDSLLFAAGALSALNAFDPRLLIILISFSAILGDTANYWIGQFFGKKLSPKIKKEYLDKTHEFYEKYGGLTIFASRFVPIVRTFAPFVAGMGKMEYKKFFFWNVAGGIVWTSLFVSLGYFFGNIPLIKQNFSIIVIGIILISVIPIIIEVLKKRN